MTQYGNFGRRDELLEKKSVQAFLSFATVQVLETKIIHEDIEVNLFATFWEWWLMFWWRKPQLVIMGKMTLIIAINH